MIFSAQFFLLIVNFSRIFTSENANDFVFGAIFVDYIVFGTVLAINPG